MKAYAISALVYLGLPLFGSAHKVELPYKELLYVNGNLGRELCCPEVQELVAGIKKELGMESYTLEVRKFSEKGLERGTPG